MKRLCVMALMGMVAAGCSNECVDLVENGLERDGVTETAVAPVRVHVSGFTVDQTDFAGVRTRSAEDVASHKDVNAVILAFYSGSTEVEKITQLKDEMGAGETFGEFSLSLPMGSYIMMAVACHVSDTSPFELTSATVAAYTGLHAFDTFTTSRTVNVSSTAAVDISATLNRATTLLKVISTDGKAAGVTNVRTTLTGGSRSFNPTTRFATDDTGFDNTVSNNATVGNPSTSLTYFFLAEDEQTMDVTIETLDADENVLFSKTLENVPFKRNRKTVLTGPMYTNNGVNGSFKVETEWLEDYNMGF